MRLRNIPRAKEAVPASSFVINEPERYRGSWQQLFGDSHPLHLEIGMGKGRFLRDMAARHPEINYIGIERYTSVLLRAIERIGQEEAPSNYRFLCLDATRLGDIFAPGEVDRIYLNFSDPWPKERHARRRLTSASFLHLYEQVLKKGKTVEFKTDNQELFDFSLESAKEAGWRILAFTRDLHRDAMGEGNVMTEYEEKFSQRGNPICKMIAAPPEEIHVR
ncbi:MAG: tRNA (guanosine(46)-N7)-methyltransferase TrmB [Lachnospiraceae bacterium]|jgi:tRNA (guanine-N7-)-methyltransferase|nr:tRNA (guanosine(46)-N7)-methyltransferase TrmB [Lachnospiraceae bacterium]